jgi:hypothetical protein
MIQMLIGMEVAYIASYATKGKCMAKDKVIGWTLVVAAFVVLAAQGNAGLLAILLPVSLLLGYGASRVRKPGTQSNERPRMRVSQG